MLLIKKNGHNLIDMFIATKYTDKDIIIMLHLFVLIIFNCRR